METKYTYDDEGRIILEIDIDDKNTLIKETRYKYEEKNGYKYVYKRVISKYNIEDSYFQIYKYDNGELISCMIKDVYNRKVYEFKDSNILINDYNNNTVTTAVLDKYKIVKLTKYKIVDNKQYDLITFNSKKNDELKFINYDEFNRIKSMRILYECDYLMVINKTTILQNPINHLNTIFLSIFDIDLNEYGFIEILYTYEKNTNKIKTKNICLSKYNCNTVFEYNDGKITNFKVKANNDLLIGTIDMNINNTNSIYEVDNLECDISIIEHYSLHTSHNLHLVYENDILVEVYDNNVKNKNEYNNKLNSLFNIPEIQHFSNIINSLEYCHNYVIVRQLLDITESFISKRYTTYNKVENSYISFTKDNYTLKSSGNVLTICKTSIDNDIKTIEVFKVLFNIRKFNKDSSIESYIKKLKEENIISNYILKYKLLPNNKEILINREEVKK